MRSYRQMADMMKSKIEKNDYMSIGEAANGIESWFAFIKRDEETNDDDKASQILKMIDYAESRIEETDLTDHDGDRIMQMVYAYISMREALELDEEDRKAGFAHLSL